MRDAFKNQVRRVLEGQELDHDRDLLRDSVFAQLPEKKKKKRILPFFFFLGALLLFIGVVHLGDNTTSILNTEESTLSSSESLIPLDGIESKSGIRAEDGFGTFNKKNRKEVSENTAEGNPSHILDPLLSQREGGSATSGSTPSGRASKKSVLVDAALEGHQRRKRNTGTYKSNTGILAPSLKTRASNNGVVIGRSQVKYIERFEIDKNIESIPASLNLSYVSKVNVLPIMPFYINVDLVEITTASPSNLLNVAVPTKRIEIAVYTFANEASATSKSTSGLFSTDAQVLIKYRINKFSPFIGVRYNRQNTVLDHSWTETSTFESLEQAAEFCPDRPDDCLNFSLLEQTTRHVNYNYINTWEVPIGLEYETGNKLVFWSRALASIPFSRSIKYEYLDEEDNIVDVNNLGNFIWTNPLNYQVSTGLGYYLTTNTQVRAGVALNGSLGTSNINELSNTLRSNQLSVGLGVDFSF